MKNDRSRTLKHIAVVCAKPNGVSYNTLFVDVDYCEGGLNFFTGTNVGRGLYLCVSPFEVTETGRSQVLGDGVRALVKPMTRFNRKVLDSYELDMELADQMIAHVCAKCHLTPVDYEIKTDGEKPVASQRRPDSSYVYHTDPRHGWLQVEIAELEELGIADRISEQSYRDKVYAYLEEDADMQLFLNAKRDADQLVDVREVKEQYSEQASFVRELKRYDCSHPTH